MRVLALDSALATASVAVLQEEEVLTEQIVPPSGNGHAATLPPLLERVLDEVGAGEIHLIGVTVGPGRFTGIRAGLALAYGLGEALGCPVMGVSVAEALAEELARGARPLVGRELWVAIDSYRGHVFLERPGKRESVALEQLAEPAGPVAIAGDAAIAVAARLAARGADVMLTDLRAPKARFVASVAARRSRGELPPLAAEPLYLDPPATRAPASPPRPAPVA
ncbi:MAG: tRNA (adenosine(37)-N6)-threonylcarbamoyltransferase complex dimerization subunit type 1 TsaB [Acidobacteriia bacterium]|nr:tRNA (adenosine(37)-N6)-threonylcarbamoyltransferase complex dimerization subunit type 1 TsaB [Methyloceanibacter sp.]MCL6492456.1 tRNA (adenosine(37)-N6)-threonylcarbamoyltransferase complex dimerization subunit type 1 TsaB [Terriglobia bacterium]